MATVGVEGVVSSIERSFKSLIYERVSERERERERERGGGGEGEREREREREQSLSSGLYQILVKTAIELYHLRAEHTDKTSSPNSCACQRQWSSL